MEFINRKGEKIDFNPFSQQSIDAAKAMAPSDGIGPAVAGESLTQIATGGVTATEQLPMEYQPLGGNRGPVEPIVTRSP